MDTNKKELGKAQKLLDQLNDLFGEMGLVKMALVSPKDCLPQQKNARYFKPEKFKQLVTNIKESGMESLPFVIPSKKAPGKYDIISGHHRVDGAKEAGKEVILVLVADKNLTRDQIVSKQLSHNALVGVDDQTLLAELFQSIEDIDQKIASGLNDDIGKIDYESLNFRVGTFKEFTVQFLPEDIGIYDEAMMEVLASETLIKSGTEVRLASMKDFERFAKVIRKVKKCENIKSNGVALLRIIELAEEYMEVSANQEKQ